MPFDKHIADSSAARCAEIYSLRPGEVQGSINLKEARFLHALIRTHAPDLTAEIGVCSGLSTAVMADALHHLNEADGQTRRLVSYDLMERLYYDPQREVGYFLSFLPAALRDLVTLRLRCTALHLREDFAPGTLDFLMIDANHAHPWPCLDLLVTLPLLRDGALVAMHDINLPLVNPAYPTHGAKHAFDALPLDKTYCEPLKNKVPNMGAFHIPVDRAPLRDELLKCAREHPWEDTVDEAWLKAAGLFEDLREAWTTNGQRRSKEQRRNWLTPLKRLFRPRD